MKQRIDLKLVSTIEASDKRLHIRDDEIDGFLLRVYPTGKLGFYMDYYSPCGANQGKRVQLKVGGSDLIKFRGNRAMGKPLQQSAVTGFRKSAKAARGLVDAGQDPSQEKRDRRSQRELEAGMRKAGQADKHRVEMVALVESNNTMRKLLAVADDNGPAGLYTNKLKVNKAGGNERKMLLQTWADIIDTPLAKVTPARISEINLARLRDPEAEDDDDVEGLRKSSIDRYNTTGHAFFKWAIDNGLCTDNPFRKEPKYAGSYDFNGDFRYLKPKESKRLITTLERMTDKGELPSYMYPLTMLALHTGARRGELFTLKWPDINGRMMTLQRGNTKSSKTRDIRLTATAVRVLKDWRTQGGAIKAGLVFPSNNPRKPMTKIATPWHKLRAAAKLNDVKFHDLRHTFAASLAIADVSLQKISQLLGHSDLKMTMRYAKLTPDHLDEIDILDDVFG
jgi:integrase